MAAIGGLVLGALSYFQQKKAADAQAKALKLQQRAQELADARARRKLLRETAIARGETVNFGAAYGALGSSALAGGLSGLTNQQQAQLGFQQTTGDISRAITRQNIIASNATSMSSALTGAGDVFSAFFKSLPQGSVSSPYKSIFGS